MSQIRDDAIHAVLDGFHRYGDVVAFRFGPFRAFLLANPDHISRVLKEEHAHFDKDLITYRTLQNLLGLGLLTSEGPLWQRQRRIAQPAFHRRRLERFVPAVADATEAMAQDWWAKPDDATVDMHTEMMALTLRIAADTLFGTGVGEREEARIAHALDVVMQNFHYRLHTPLALPEWLPTSRNRKLAAAHADLDGVVERIIDERRRAGDADERDDLLSRFMAARDEETGEAMDDRQLRDEVMTLLLAGHETTANALTFTWHLLGRHPEVAEAARREIHEVLGNRAPTAEDLPRLDLVRRIVQESMRLYPPAWVVERRALRDMEFGGHRVPKGSICLLSQFVTHRHPDHWQDPDRFDPDRFTPEASQGRHPFAYFPFSGGPRVCIGAGFAMLEAPLVLAGLLRRFDPRPLLEDEPELSPLITLRPRDGLPMALHPLRYKSKAEDTP